MGTFPPTLIFSPRGELQGPVPTIGIRLIVVYAPFLHVIRLSYIGVIILTSTSTSVSTINEADHLPYSLMRSRFHCLVGLQVRSFVSPLNVSLPPPFCLPKSANPRMACLLLQSPVAQVFFFSPGRVNDVQDVGETKSILSELGVSLDGNEQEDVCKITVHPSCVWFPLPTAPRLCPVDARSSIGTQDHMVGRQVGRFGYARLSRFFAFFPLHIFLPSLRWAKYR
ncbi:hypothetical protein F5Y16DRAFT_324570 [Xylariaceae sp. FL0255]|nr:hypothetical protein F5Y16DRAFT_324570 [Xylariaceae sp. FL0255]